MESEPTASTSGTHRRESLPQREITDKSTIRVPQLTSQLSLPGAYTSSGIGTSGPGKCLKCLNLIALTGDTFRCGVCRGRVHIKCTPGTFSQSEINKLQSSSTPFTYVCYKCSPSWNNKGINTLDPTDVIKRLNEQHQKELKDLNAKMNQMETDRTNFERETQDLKRQLDTLTNRFGRYELENDRKRAREALDDTFVEINDPTTGELSGYQVQNRTATFADNDILSQLKALLVPIQTQLSTLSERMDKMQESRDKSATRNANRIQNLNNVNPPGSTSVRAHFPALQPPPRSKTNTQKLTFAQALAASKTPVECIRNINIVEDCEKTMGALRRDGICADVAVKSIKERGKCSLTVKAATPKDAESIEQKLKDKYGVKIEVKKVDDVKPMVKVTRIYTDLKDSVHILDRLIEHNNWMSQQDFTIERMYSIGTGEQKYTNLILNCNDFATQRLFLDRKKAIYGFR